MKSTTYQQIQAEARAEATQELLAGLIRQRLPRQARRLIERLKACPPEVLARVAKRLFDEHMPRGDRELLAELEALLAD